MIPPLLDHLVDAVPDLAVGVDDLAGRVGVRAVPGGSHAGRGTVNYLLGLGGEAYLEIIGPDRDQPGRGLPVVPLVSLTATHPDPAPVRAELAALGTALDVARGPPALHAVLAGPGGLVPLG